MRLTGVKSAALLLGTFVIGFALAIPATEALAISRSGMVAYAKQYACNGNQSCRNSDYISLNDVDCTNFVSQAMRAGGFGFIHSGSSTQVWYYDNGFFAPSYSKTWSSVGMLMGHLLVSGRVTGTLRPNMLAKYSGASGGDIYFYDWGKGEGWSHAAISTNSGTFANYYSPADTIPYSAVTGGSGDRVAQHSNDRVDSPWNFGFYIETDKPIRDNMQTIVYHLN